MSSLRKTIFGYNMRDVNRYLRSLKRLSEAEISEWESKVADAAHDRSSLMNRLAALEESQAPEHESAVSAALAPPERMAPETMTTVTGAAEECSAREAPADEETLLADGQSDDELQAHSIGDSIDSKETAAIEEPADTEKQAQPVEATVKLSNLVHFRRKHEAAEVYGGFWEGVETYMQMPAVITGNVETQAELASALSLPQQDGTNFTADVPRYFNYSINDALVPLPAAKPSLPSRGRGTNERLNALPQKKPEQEAQEKEKAAEARPAQAQTGSRAVTKEVRQLRYQYIVGKLAGEDLLSDSGDLIIAKHQPITEAVVDEADKEGKLALLIIQMTIPGMEEES
ncbi:hypothetical protein [Paenibacillus thermotolerans]|uniref:hypothetical protein n=1 Tax=Paenibacillus thermotolerans TaxID=3027807 RepID=UPI002368A627|nr:MULTISPECIES: hypothetical protein [unclassified Paenibacillus]